VGAATAAVVGWQQQLRNTALTTKVHAKRGQLRHV
jgi:hypothetical protein